MYFVQSKKYEEESEVNCKIRKLFVEREVRSKVTDIVRYIFDTASCDNAPPFDINDVDTSAECFCPDCGGLWDHYTVVKEDTTPIVDPTAQGDEKYACPICGATYEFSEDARDCCAGLIVRKCSECGKIMSEDEIETAKTDELDAVVDWYMVTPWLQEKLAEHSEITISIPPLWGCQHVEDDLSEEYTIKVICKELEICEGQKHDWSKHFKD